MRRGAVIAVLRGNDRAFGGRAMRALGRLRLPFFAQHFDGFFEIAIRFDQRAFGIHHLCAGFLAQIHH